jgi:hypothetical protein
LSPRRPRARAFNLPALIRGESLLQRLSAGRLTLGRPGAKQPQADPYVPDGERLVDPLYRSARFGYKLFRKSYVTRAAQPESYVLNHPNRPRALAAQHNFAVTVVIVPSDARPYGHAFENTPQISAEPHFVNYLKRLSVEIWVAVVALSQWNDRGHEVVAEVLSRSAFR